MPCCWIQAGAEALAHTLPNGNFWLRAGQPAAIGPALIEFFRG